MYLVSPAHLINPWAIMMEKKGHIATALQTVASTQDLLHYQAQDVLKCITQWNVLNVNVPFVLIGDFNSPTYPVLGSVVQLLTTTGMTLLTQEMDVTFPEHDIRIDHAFGNSSVKVLNEQILKWDGSDHYPISMEVSLGADGVRVALKR